MGYPTGQVDIPGLGNVGAAVEHAASSFAQPHDPLAPAGVLHGWASEAALSRAGEVWPVFIGNLAGQIRGFGADLTATAGAYRDVDAAAAQRVTAADGRQHAR